MKKIIVSIAALILMTNMALADGAFMIAVDLFKIKDAAVAEEKMSKKEIAAWVGGIVLAGVGGYLIYDNNKGSDSPSLPTKSTSTGGNSYYFENIQGSVDLTITK